MEQIGNAFRAPRPEEQRGAYISLSPSRFGVSDLKKRITKTHHFL
jgi:hypothetical protein